MRVIPVLDLVSGRAVRASRGQRAGYAPAPSVLVPDAQAGDPLALALAFRKRLGCDEWYVADLDALAGGAPQRALVRALVGVGGHLLLDSGAATPAQARDGVSDGAARVVVGLETLPSFDALREIAGAIGSAQVVFSLDLRDGTPVVPSGAPHHATPLELVRRAITAGAAAVLVLDLARIGTGRGVDLALVDAIRRAHAGVELLAGGGIGSTRDLDRLSDAGCDGALVATALHDGRLGGADVEAAPRRGRRGDHPSDSR